MEIQEKKKPFLSPVIAVFLLFFLVISVVIYKEFQPSYYLFNNPHTAQEYHLLAKHYLIVKPAQFNKAIEMAQRSIALAPKFGAAYLDLGVAYVGLGQYDRAIGVYMHALPFLTGETYNLQVAYHDIGIAYYDLRNDEKAWEYFNKADQLGAYKNSGLKAKLDPRLRIALESNKIRDFKAVDKDKYALPTEIRNMLDGFRKDVQLGKAQEVINRCNDYLEQNPKTPYASSFKELLAFAYLSERNLNASMKVSQELLMMDLNDEGKAYVRFNMAYIYSLQRNYTASLAAYDEVIKYYPHFDQIDLVYLGKAEILVHTKKYYEASNFLNNFIEQHPTDPHLYKFQSLLAKAYLSLGDRLRAYELMEKTGEMKKFLLYLVLASLITVLILFAFLGAIKWFFREKWRADPQKDIFLWSHLKFVLAFTIIVPTFMSVVVSYVYIHFYLSSDFIDPLLCMGILFEAFFFALVLFIFRKIYKLRSHEMGLVSMGFKTDILLPIGVVLGTFGVAVLIACLFTHLGIHQKQQPIVIMAKRILAHFSFLNVGALFFLTVIIGPYVEELVFRGFVFRILYKYMNLFWAVLLSAFLWASCHYFTPMIIIIFFQGLILALIYHRTKSLVPCIVTHMIWNFFVFLVILLTFYSKLS